MTGCRSRTAEFLLRVQAEQEPDCRGAIPLGYSNESQRWMPACYSFDNAICAAAFVDVYRTTGKRCHLDAAKKIGDWFLKEMQCLDGSFRAVAMAQDEGFPAGRGRHGAGGEAVACPPCTAGWARVPVCRGFRRSRNKLGIVQWSVPVYYPWTMMIACQAMEWLRRVESLTTGDIVAELF